MPHVNIKLSIKGKNISLVLKVIENLWGEIFYLKFGDSIRIKGSHLQFNDEVNSEQYLYYYEIFDLINVLKKLFPDLYIYERIIDSFTENKVVNIAEADNSYFLLKKYEGRRKTELLLDLDGQPITNLQVFLRKKKLQKLNKLQFPPKNYSEDVLFQYIKTYQKAVLLRKKRLEIEDEMETELKKCNSQNFSNLFSQQIMLTIKNSEIMAQCNKILLNG